MRPWLVIILAVAAVAYACGWRSTAPRATVEDAWVRLPAVAGRPAAGYFTVEINGTRETLLSVSSPSAERIELHFSRMEGGRMKMERLEESSTRLGRPIRFEPGGAHLMLFGLDPALRPGDALELNFRFLLAPPATAQARLVAAGDAAPDHAEH